MNIGSYVTRGARGRDSGEEDFGFWNLNGTLDFGIAQVQNGKWKLGQDRFRIRKSSQLCDFNLLELELEWSRRVTGVGRVGVDERKERKVR